MSCFDALTLMDAEKVHMLQLDPSSLQIDREIENGYSLLFASYDGKKDLFFFCLRINRYLSMFFNFHLIVGMLVQNETQRKFVLSFMINGFPKAQEINCGSPLMLQIENSIVF